MMFLTPADLQALTGYRRAHEQIKWLRARHWVYELGGDGRPRLLWAYVNRMMGGVDSTPPTREPKLRLRRQA